MGLFSKIFGKGNGSKGKVQDLVEENLQGLIEKAGFELSFEVKVTNNDKGAEQVYIDFFGDDEELLKNRDGSLLDAFQLYIRRVIQHNFPEESPIVICDTDGFRDEANKSLINLVEKLRDRAIEQNRSVYLRQLPPKDRKVVHQFLAEDGRVKSRSIGDGLYKKIKIYPVRKNDAPKEGARRN